MQHEDQEDGHGDGNEEVVRNEPTGQTGANGVQLGRNAGGRLDAPELPDVRGAEHDQPHAESHYQRVHAKDADPDAVDQAHQRRGAEGDRHADDPATRLVSEGRGDEARHGRDVTDR